MPAVPGSSNECTPRDTYLHTTNEAQIVYYVWFKPNEGLHGLEMKFLNRIEPTSLIIYDNCTIVKG